MTDLSNIVVDDAFKQFEIESLADGLSTGFASLRYKGKMWNLNLGGKSYPFKDEKGYNLPYVDFIVLKASPFTSQIYFGEWNEDAASGPICASVKGDVPDPGVSIPQSKTCATCDHYQWAMKPNGSRKPDCQAHRRVAVLLMPSMTKKLLPAPLREPVYFKIPPGSFKSWKKFDDELQHAGIRFYSVITRVSFVDGQQFEMKFEVLQGLTAKEAPVVLPLRESAQTLQIVGGMTGSPRQIAAPAQPKPPERIETGLTEMFGADDDEDEATPPPPKKTRAKKAPVIDNEPSDAPLFDSPAPKAVASAPPEENGGWEESDTELDETVKKLMSKTSNMLK